MTWPEPELAQAQAELHEPELAGSLAGPAETCRLSQPEPSMGGPLPESLSGLFYDWYVCTNVNNCHTFFLSAPVDNRNATPGETLGGDSDSGRRR
jgi:hypothetical protein